MRLIRKLEGMKDFWFLISFNLLFFLLRLPSLFEPYWYGDEGIYQAIGLALRNGEVLYRDIWDNKTPALYYLYAILGSDQFLTKLASLIFGIAGITFFFLLAKKLFIKGWVYKTSTLIFTLLFGLPIIEGNIANAENFMIPMIITSAYLVYTYHQKKKHESRYLIAAGLILGVSFLFKIISVFDFAAFFTFIFIYDFPDKLSVQAIKEQISKRIIPLSIIAVSFFIPFLITVIYFHLNHILKLYLSSIFLSNVGYVGYGNKFLIPQGLLILKLIILTVSLLIIIAKRKAIKFNSSIFVLIWLSFSFFNMFFSQRGYPHYVLVILPTLCLVFGLIFIYNKFSKTMALIFIGSALIVLNFFSLYWKSVQYYKNFLSFTFDHKSVTDYQSFFDKKTPRDYSISNFLKSNLGKDGRFFIWGNNAQIYALANKVPITKYTVAYHITQYPDGLVNAQKNINKYNPKFIVIMPNVSDFPFSLYNYQINMNIGGVLIYERNN